MTIANDKNTIIDSKNQLIKYITDGFKPTSQSSIGIEFESFLYQKKDISPVLYHSNNQKHGLGDILHGFNNSWTPVIENYNVIGLESEIGNISLEPAGQFEFSSIPAKNIIDLNNFTQLYWQEAIPLFNKHDIGIYNLGYNPIFNIKDLPLMPKERYNIMFSHMKTVGTTGMNMMKQTATVQTNLDYASENDLGRKLNLSMKITPIVIALFANSPFVEGNISSNLSHRMHIWHDTDKKRSGLLKFAFDGDFSIEKYVDYALMVPMYFIKRNNKYINMTNITFKNYLNGSYQLVNNDVTMMDFIDHLSTLFPDVRLKNYLEIRTADCVDKDYLMSLCALFCGLFYDDGALTEALSLVNSWSYNDVYELKNQSIIHGLNASINNKPLYSIANEILSISHRALVGRKLGEEKFLSPLIELCDSKKTLSENKIEIFKSLGNNMNKLIEKISIS